VGSAAGVPDEKFDALPDYATSPLFSEAECAALAYADAISFTDQDVDEALFARVRQYFDDDQIVELTATIAWENCSSKFNRALRVPSHDLWQRKSG
jgi:alkylhydroperoxidase family enzyme